MTYRRWHGAINAIKKVRTIVSKTGYAPGVTMTDYKTLRVPEDAWEKAKAQKEEHNRTWGEQLLQSEPQDGPEIVIETVEVNTEGDSVDPSDVETIVENWIENNYDALRRGEI